MVVKGNTQKGVRHFLMAASYITFCMLRYTSALMEHQSQSRPGCRWLVTLASFG